MNFQVVNDKGRVIMHTDYNECIPGHDDLLSMQKAGYKFKIDGKNASIRKIKEIKENN